MNLLAIKSIVSRVEKSLVQIGRGGRIFKRVVDVRESFHDLPKDIIDYWLAKKYDPLSMQLKSMLKGETIYIIADTIKDGLELEEILFHENMHLILRADGKSLLSSLCKAMMARIGGQEKLTQLANEMGVSLDDYHDIGDHLSEDQKTMLYIEEFMANLEGQRVYQKLPERIMRGCLEFWGWFREMIRGMGYLNLYESMRVKLNDINSADIAYLMRGIRGSSIVFMETSNILNLDRSARTGSAFR